MNVFPLLPGGCSKDRSKRSAIFDRATTRTLSRNQGVAGNRKTWSWSGWVKRGTLGILSGIFGASVGNATYYFWAYFDTDDRLKLGQFGAGTVAQLITTAVYRDPTAWMHILIVSDTTQATAADRLRLYVNGQQITSFTASTYPAQNTDLVYNSNIPHRIGAGIDVDGGLYQPITCNMAEVHFTDGIVLQPANVGVLDHHSNAWRHKHFSGDHGAQGYYLPFIGDAGDAPATAAEAAKDRAPITGAHVAANNWTVNNFSAADFVIDSPTNFAAPGHRGDFATLNPIDRRVGVGTITEGNLRIAATTINPHRTRSTIPFPTSGKYIFSAELIAGGSLNMTGLMRADLSTNDASPNLGLRSGEVSYIASSGEVYKENALQGTFATITTVGHHAVWAIDVAGNRAWIGKWDGVNLVWFGGGNPAAGTLPTLASLPAGKLFPCIAPDTGVTLKAWFGAQGFPFAVPAGFNPLVISALPRSTVIKPPQAFVQAVDSGANIVTNLTAKRSGWGASYVEIIKSVAAEGWRIRFGSDAGFYYDSSNAGAGRQAYPALAGASYWGCSLRIGAQYGVAAGSVVHVNGVASVVADGLNTARKAVILFPRAGGNMPVYHPETNAGELLYLNLTNGDAPATDITAVTSSGFSIGAGMASGTYDWLVVAETSGLIALTKNAGTGQADGPFIHTGMAPGMIIDKRIDAADGWYLFDAARNTYNPRDRQLRLETNIAEVPGTTFGDFLANGAKVRTTAVGFNASGGSYVQISIAAASFANGECAAQGTAN